jgi:2-octaprenyl-6-methoxyphenol hydroxylase
MPFESPSQSPSFPSNDPSPNFDYDLIIVGGGIVGAILAAALKDSGLHIGLIEARTQSQAVEKGQAYAISLLSERILRGIGIWDEISPQITTCQKICLSDGTRPGGVQFHPEDLGTDRIVHVAEHRVLLGALQTWLNRQDNVRWLCPAFVETVEYKENEAIARVKIDGEIQTLRSRLVVGADGARSRIRTDAGIQTHGWSYWQSCLVATIGHEHPHHNIAYERFWSSGPFAILPLPGNRCRIVWSAPHAEAQALANLDEAEFLERLRPRYVASMGRLSLEGKRFVFPVQWRQSDRYVRSRLALVGDAAHGCHPVGGQGLNMGIRDAAALAQVLQEACQQGQNIGQLSVLQRYERWRKPENLAILGFTDLLDRLFSNDFPPLVALRQLGLWGLRQMTPLRVYPLKLMTGLSGRLPELGS